VIPKSAALAARRHHRRQPSTPVTRTIALIALLAPLAMLPVAGASLPDLLCVPGIYDGGDADDVVALVGEGGSPKSFVPAISRPALPSVTSVPADSAPLQPHLRPLLPRAPPSA
jgi:hypothetical protein